MKFVIDRFEGDYAVLEKEDGGTIDVLKSLIENGAEGDVLVFDGESYTKDKEETQTRKKRIEEKMKRLFQQNN